MYFYMSNKKSAVIGRANLGNKPNYNAFDLSHRNSYKLIGQHNNNF